MSQPIKKGDRAVIIAGALGDKGPNVGKEVTVGLLRGEHSVYGLIWRVHGAGLVSDMGVIADEVDCAASWLQKIDPESTPNNAEHRDLETSK